jgi:hypothetical protein
MTTKQKFSASDRVVAWRSFGHASGFVQLGETYRGSHPVVQQFPDHFILADTPLSEWPNGFVDPPEHEPEAPGTPGSVFIKPAPLPHETCFCTVNFRKGNRQFRIGEAYRMTDPIVRENAGYFEVRRSLADVLAEQGS